MLGQDDRHLLGLLQRGLPLTPQPFAQIASELGQCESAVIDRLDALRKAGVIREISAIFDAALLGYHQELIAFEISPDQLAGAGENVSGHPGVSHCYGRQGKYNLWFTLATSPRSKLGLTGTVERLAKSCNAKSHLRLPSIKRYKLKVEFLTQDPSEHQEPCQPCPQPTAATVPLTDEQMRAIRALQIDLPSCSEPFEPLARAADITVHRLLALAQEFKANGSMRRYAAVLHHQQVGAAANVMVAWKVEPAAADAAGAKCSSVPAVSHCYLRPSSPQWPFNLYTMIHGRSREDCEMSIAEIAAVTELRERCELWTTTEFKKERVRLFGDEEQLWESQYA